MKTEYIKFEDYLKRKEHINRLEERGFKLLYSKNTFKKVVGVGCLVVAIIPNGVGIFFYPLGFYLLKINRIDLYRHKENLLRKLRYNFIELKRGFKKWNI